MRLKSGSNHKEPIYEETKRHKEQVQLFSEKPENVCRSLPWRSKKYGYRSRGAHKYELFSCSHQEKKVKIYDALRNLISFVQFKKREKHPQRGVTFRSATLLKVTLLYGCFSRF